MPYLKMTVLLAACTAFLFTEPAEVSAADLAVTPTKKVRVIHKSRARVVRDYDGTPVVERRIRSVERRGDGTVVVVPRYEMIYAERATPSRYLNGQPVLPTTSALHPTRIVVTRYR